MTEAQIAVRKAAKEGTLDSVDVNLLEPENFLKTNGDGSFSVIREPGPIQDAAANGQLALLPPEARTVHALFHCGHINRRIKSEGTFEDAFHAATVAGTLDLIPQDEDFKRGLQAMRYEVKASIERGIATSKALSNPEVSKERDAEAKAWLKKNVKINQFRAEGDISRGLFAFNETLGGEGFYVSYNDRDVALHGSTTTALAPDDMSRFYVLRGDHRPQYQDLVPEGWDACISYFKECHEVQALAPYAKSAIEEIDAQRDRLSPLDFARHRENVMADALSDLFEKNGHPLSRKLSLNADAEFLITAQTSFGPTMARLLTNHEARTGIAGPNKIIAQNAWCMLNHFKAEAMLRDVATKGNLVSQTSDKLPDALPAIPSVPKVTPAGVSGAQATLEK